MRLLLHTELEMGIMWDEKKSTINYTEITVTLEETILIITILLYVIRLPLRSGDDRLYKVRLRDLSGLWLL